MDVVYGVILSACLVAAGGISPAMAGQLDIILDPSEDMSPFTMTYQRTVFVEYPPDGALAEYMRGQEWNLIMQASSRNPGVWDLARSINEGIREDGSIAYIDIGTAEYSFRLVGRDTNVSFDVKLVLSGSLNGYVITRDQTRTLVDLGWRGMSSDDSIVIDGVDVNVPLRALEGMDPVLYGILRDGEPGRILSIPLINADYLQETPLSLWHFLFDPTGISPEPIIEYGLSEDLIGVVYSAWTVGESKIGLPPRELKWEASVDGATHPDFGPISYDIRAVQAPESATLRVIGFGAVDMLDGVEMAGVTPKPPEGFGNPATGDFPVMIIYGMAGLAAAGGALFFVVSSRALKNEKRCQQGIDPSRLVGRQTSSAAGGYRTNRGEAQLRDDVDYQRSRSYYDDDDDVGKASGTDQAICTCADSAGSQCDCQMQGACICDETCGCGSDTCREYVSSMS